MDDTIAAISTAYGEGGIGIVRISGPEALSILERMFMPVRKHYSGRRVGGPAEQEGDAPSDKRLFLPESVGETIGDPLVNRRLTYGTIVDPGSGQIIDEVLAVYMKGPYTYTAEDVAEIHCHGSVVALRKVLSLSLRMGARAAEPGEFTKRAFLNGRLDLSQAEAVIDLIRAKTDKRYDVALDQLSGAMSKEISRIRGSLMDLLVELTVNIDYPDEDIEELTYEKLKISLSTIGDMIEKLLSTADTGRIIREGLSVAIVGKPNVGKSSLMNALLRESRAIVTEIPGTTRDTIEEVISVRSIPVKLTDTAGIRRTEDKIERIGIEKSKESFNRADLILFVLDGSSGLTEEDREIVEYIGRRPAIVLLNKSDLGAQVAEAEIKQLLAGGNATILSTSILLGEGIAQIEEKIVELVYGGRVAQSDSLLVTNARHQGLLEQALQAVKDALTAAEGWQALDFIQIDVDRCYGFLGEIIGETACDDVIEAVFERFCLGK